MVLDPVVLNPVVVNQHTPVLLLRGLSREQRHWGRLRPVLSSALPNPLLSFDYAGCGELYRQHSAADIGLLRQSVREQLQQSPAFNGKVHLVALSLGGMLALDWALQYPQEVASVVLINSSARPLSPFYQRLCWRNYPALLALPWLSLPLREQLILQLTSRKARRDPQLVKCWIGYQQQRPVSRANMLRQLWAAARFRLSAAPVCPSLVLSSAADSLVNPGCSLALARYLRAEHQQHSWAGHDIALDDPDWLASQIAGFIQRQV